MNKFSGNNFTIYNEDAFLVMRKILDKYPQGHFDMIFVDPPYDAGLYAPVLETINQVDNLSDGGIIICEARRETELPEMAAPYRKGREYRYGKIKLCLYTKEQA